MRGGKVAFLTLLVLSRENSITQTSWRKKEERRGIKLLTASTM